METGVSFPTPAKIVEICLTRPASAAAAWAARKTLTRVAATVSLAGAALLLGSCTTNIVDPDVSWAETTADAETLMTASRGAFGINGTPRAIWIDPRGEAEFKAERIPGAVNLPFSKLEAEHMVALKDKDVLMVYDSDSDSALALTYAKRLLALGYKDVYCLRGGLKAWKRDGHKTDKS